MNRTLNLLHSLNVVKTHKVKAQAVKIVFLYPIGSRINHKLAKHISFGRRIVSASACRGVCARRSVSVIIVRNYAVKGAVCIIGVIINNVHNNSDSRLVKSGNHLLILINSKLSLIGIGRVATLGNVIVLRIIAPVKRRIRICLVNRCVIVNGKQMNVSYAEILKVIYTYRNAVLILKTRLGKCKIFALILRGFYLIREVSNVNLPNDRL